MQPRKISQQPGTRTVPVFKTVNLVKTVKMVNLAHTFFMAVRNFACRFAC
jgi:hypothetical protein